MLQEKHGDLDAEKRKKLITRLLEDLSRSNPDLYYQPTSQIALQIKQQVDEGTNLSNEDRALLSPLTLRDIEVLLSLH
ncbi:hypothetical protein [Roseibium alexandrii]|uniref:Uncharacterized protein n=1 Tax=Roseibium alexandrii (strain DSM 17067 / NCIMB 14079 / DFL-11) TaxID=244592 RepID=A0A5E8GX59_ROSAD|nr:hypothetical protein [Roseibium alexandrii]EEE44031.1 hypothetical protein SADFL11_1317 [Roseibium alexandrii DFL-11]